MLNGGVFLKYRILDFMMYQMTKDPKPQDVDLAVVDAKELKKIKEKQEKIERVMWLIKENWLDKDPEFMNEVMEAFDGILEIQK